MSSRPIAVSSHRSWRLSYALNNKFKPRIEAVSGISMSEQGGSSVPPLWRVARSSFEQANYAVRLWDAIHRGECRDVMDVQLCAQRFETEAGAHIRRLTASMNRDVESEWRDEIASLKPLLMTDIEQLKLKLALVGNGRMSGETSSHIAEGAALLYLSSYLSQMAIVTMAVRGECTRPMKDLTKDECTSIRNLSLMRSYCEKIAGANGVMGTIRRVMHDDVSPAVMESDLLSDSSRVAVNSVGHTINNRLTAPSGNLELLKEYTQSFLGGDNRAYISFREILGEWETITDKLVHTAISDDELIIYIGNRHRDVELIVDGHVPKYVDAKKLNMAVNHFVHNALVHPKPGQKSKVAVMQTNQGIYVMDVGTGISLDRLRMIERQVLAGKTVRSDHEAGTGSGLRDSVILLKELFGKDELLGANMRDRQAAITIASKEGGGTISSITWGERMDEVKSDLVPQGWNYIQFSPDVEGEGIAERAGSNGLPRPISNIFSRYRPFGEGVGISG